MADTRDESTVSAPPRSDEPNGPSTQFTVPAPADSARRSAQPVPGALNVGEELFGRYRVVRKLGAGGMGVVYLTWDALLHRHVALKVCRFPDALAAQRFLQEARAAAALQHPNICQVFDFLQLDDLHCLFMPYFEGEVLRTHTAAERLLPPDEAARVVRVVALAMQAAHDAGVIHRDLKPSNIILNGSGEPIVVDFGLARRTTDSGLTLGGPMGTPAYMSPEQCAGDFSRVGPPADVYSLGVVLYELLTGAPPFAGSACEMMAQNQSALAPAPSLRRPGLDPRFDHIVLTALTKAADRRWPSMRAFADALAELAAPPAAPELVLSVVGTLFAYRPRPGWTVLKVGRQRRKPGVADGGNDLVIRVAGNEALSARISRHHFEIRRTPTGLVLVDRSTMGLTRNGTAVVKGEETPVADGDLLGVAGVVTLKVAVAAPQAEVCRVDVIDIPAPASAGRIELEASLGDVVTVG